MALKPETIARIQGILDGTIKVDPQPVKPFDPSELSEETRKRLADQLGNMFNEVRAEVAARPVEETLMAPEEEPLEESLRNADEIIKLLADNDQGDYSAFRREIALDIYDNGHFNGNWDSHFNPDDYGSDLTGFRVIQEDEYDQHMDEDEDKPEVETMLGDVPNGYLWMH